MTRASGIGPLPQLLEQMCGGKSVERVFRAAGLPGDVVEDPDLELPLLALVDLFDIAGRRAADPLFGLRVGLGMAPISFGPWVAYAMAADNLGAALNRLSHTLPMHQPDGHLTLSHARGGLVVWSYVSPKVGRLPVQQHSDHILPVMIAACRRYLGADWLPLRVRMNYPDPGDAAARADLLPVPWTFEGSGVSLVFPAALLAARKPWASAETAQVMTAMDVAARLAMLRAQTLEDSIEAIVALRFLDGRADIDGVARLSGASVRSLQRRLSDMGTSYSALLDRVRDRKARALLLETDLSVTGIALSLGYSDPANFSRAFSRRTGIAPQQFRAARTG